MDRPLVYAAVGCFIGTLASMLFNRYTTDPFLLFLFPMWGLILGVSIARVVDKRSLQKETLKK